MTKMTADVLEFEISGIKQNNPQIDCSIEGEDLYVTLQNSALCGVVLAAEYDANGVLLFFTTHLLQEELKIPLRSATRTAKVMWWESLQKMKPFAKAKTATRKSDV